MQEFSPAGTPQSLVFGKYAVLRRLAIGGMGEVFLARQTGVLGFDRLVILKSLLPELAEQEGFVEQFLDEARVVATLNHPNIVQTYEVGKHDGVYFIAMEYISGENLGRLQKLARKAERPMPVTVAVKVIHDAASGLDHAHKALDVHGRPLELVHRDISPQNIMVRGDGVTKVVDFGIAKASNRATRTATGTLKGKVQYMPPEQLNTEVLDHRCDQFALGVVLWELLTDEKLFGGNNELETIKNVLMAPIRKPSEVRPGLSAGLDDIVIRMLQRDRDRRYPSLA
ncbi:MAG: serine/threonine protein kinase, partial [Myxococcota bacterium]